MTHCRPSTSELMTWVNEFHRRPTYSAVEHVSGVRLPNGKDQSNVPNQARYA